MSANPLSPPSTAPLQPGDLVDPKEAADILDTTPRTLANWRALGKGPPYRKVGERMVRYHRADLTAFAAGDPHEGKAA